MNLETTVGAAGTGQTAMSSSNSGSVEPVEQSAMMLALWFSLPGALAALAMDLLPDLSTGTASRYLLLIAAGQATLVATATHLLTTSRATRLPAVSFSLLLGVVTALLSYRFNLVVGLSNDGIPMSPSPLWLTTLGTVLICVVSVPLFRVFVERRSVLSDYPSLFEFAWNSVVAGCIAVAFTLLVAGLLLLAVNLFDIIGLSIEFLQPGEPAFSALMGATIGSGAGIARTREVVMHSQRHILLSLLNILLPMHLCVTALFCLIAFWQGLDSVPDTFSVTALLLLAAMLAISFCSAAIGDDRHNPPALRGWALRLQNAVLLPLSALALLGLWYRIDAEGLTPARLVALVTALFTTAYAVGYLLAALQRQVPPMMRWTNIVLALMALLLGVLIQTPLLDFYQLSARSQVQRVQRGEIDLGKLDLGFLYQRLGTAGTEAIEILQADGTIDQESLSRRLDELDAGAMDMSTMESADAERLLSSGSIQVATGVSSADAAAAVRAALAMMYRPHRCDTAQVECVVTSIDGVDSANPQMLLFIRDLADELELRMVLIRRGDDNQWLLAQDPGDFEPETILTGSSEELEALFNQAAAGSLQLATVLVRALRIGGRLYLPGVTQPADYLESNSAEPQ